MFSRVAARAIWCLTRGVMLWTDGSATGMIPSTVEQRSRSRKHTDGAALRHLLEGLDRPLHRMVQQRCGIPSSIHLAVLCSFADFVVVRWMLLRRDVSAVYAASQRWRRLTIARSTRRTHRRCRARRPFRNKQSKRSLPRRIGWPL